MMAVMYFAGVTSKAGFWMAAPFGCHLLAVGVRDLGGGALLDGDLVAVRGGDVDGRERSGDVERDAVLLGEDGDGVGADLVGGVAVGGDAVGSDDDGLDACPGASAEPAMLSQRTVVGMLSCSSSHAVRRAP